MGPEPSWVVPAPAAPGPNASPDASVALYPLDDTQERVTAKTAERYRHFRYRPRSPVQVEEGSQVEIDFNPAFQRLVIHYVRVEREGRAVGTLAAREVKLVQREKDLEGRIYDGTLTALIVLHDVRVGDVVDCAYTVEGANPVLAGKYVGAFSVADRSFMASWRRRVVLPEARSLTVKNHGIELPAAVTTGGGWRVYTWERHDVAPIEPEDELPPWFDPAPSIEATEFGSWAEVAALFARTYAVEGAASPMLSAQIAKLRSMTGTAEDRLLAATRFVQDDIRYLGVELSLGGHRPFPPSTVLERRFGDCKDKSVLLVTILRALGFEAHTALVSTEKRRALDDALPSPVAFDHAIVEVAFEGHRSFIDPTSAYERGPLSARQPPDFERALILAPETRALVPIPRPGLKEPTQLVREVLTVADDGHAADLEVETTLRGAQADHARDLFAERTRKEIGRDYLNYYSKDDPTVSQTAELQVTDDERLDVVTVRERYHVAELWKDGQRELGATAIEEHLGAPRIKLRSMPYGVDFPLNVSSEMLVRFPFLFRTEPETLDVGDDHLHFRFEARARDRELSIRYELQSLDDTVAPAQAHRFFQVQDEMRRRAGYVLRRPEPVAGGSSSFETLKVVGLIACLPVLAGLVLGVRSLGRLSKRRRVQDRYRFEPGESAATAIEVASAAWASARVEGLRCSCGARYRRGSAEPAGSVIYGGRTLAVWAVACGDCQQRRSVFFAVGEGDAADTK